MKVLVKVTGSISVFKICSVVSSLIKRGHEVKVCATDSSLNFVGASTWEGLTRQPVFSNDFAPTQRMQHIDLNEWADLIVLAPATAKTLNQLASGVGDSVITTLFLARELDTPYVIFPAMNPKMWENHSVQKSVETLRAEKSIHIVTPRKGLMACGDYGVGRLWEPEDILKTILNYEPKTKKALITYGGTSESIDGVRYLSNFSTGQTGKSLIEALSYNYHVTELHPKSLKPSVFSKESFTYTSSDDLETLLLTQAHEKDYDLIVHAAAVSDYKPLQVSEKKLSSESESRTLELKRRDKILNKIKDKAPQSKLVSFKLTHNESEKEIQDKITRQFEDSKSDYIIHNSLSDSRGERHSFQVWSIDNKDLVFEGKTKEELKTYFKESFVC